MNRSTNRSPLITYISSLFVSMLLIISIGAAAFAAHPPSLAQRQVAAYQRDYPSVHLIFGGDVMLGRSVDAAMQKYGDDYPFVAISDTLRSADLAVANLESSLTTQTTPYKPDDKWINLRGRPASAAALTRAGFDVVTVANNHALDYGTAGLDDTVSALKGSGLSVIGTTDQPAFVTVRGLRLAFLGYDCINTSQPSVGTKLAALACSGTQVAATKAAVQADIRHAKQQADAVIVFMHWGIEYAATPGDYQRDLAQAMADAGATLIVGCHPHVAQGLTLLGHTLVAYSLGNFVFDQRVPNEAVTGMLLDVIIERSGVTSATLRPVNTYIQARLLSAEDAPATAATIAAARSSDAALQWQAVVPPPQLPASVNPALYPVTPTLALSYQREGQASGWLGDLDGDGRDDWLSYTASPNPAGSVTVYTPLDDDWQRLMSTPAKMQVQQFFVIPSLEGRGEAPSIFINLWQPDYRWGGHGKLKNQLCLYSYWQRQRRWDEKWCGRPRAVINYRISVVNDDKAILHFAVLEGNDPSQARLTIFTWGGFDFGVDWQARGKGYTHLASDPAAHRFLYR